MCGNIYAVFVNRNSQLAEIIQPILWKMQFNYEARDEASDENHCIKLDIYHGMSINMKF